MSAQGKSAIKLYYWQATFQDGTRIAQFDDFGNEILIKTICPKKYQETSPATNQTIILPHANVFEEYEKIHGRVVKIGWYPYNQTLAARATKKQPTLRIALNEELVPLEVEVPQGYYVGAPKDCSKVEFAVKMLADKKVMIPVDSLQWLIGISLFPLEQGFAPITKQWQVQYT